MSYFASLARQQNTELDRELSHSIRTRTPMYDRPAASYTGLRRLGNWLALTGQSIRDRKISTPAGAERSSVTIRPATEADEREIATLSELNERRVPKGYVLVAQLDESIIAAKPLDGGHTVIDPRRSSSDVIELLELRSRQLQAGDAELADAA
jgi:hypothetical protein